MGDQAIDAAAAQGLRACACRARARVAWAVVKGRPDCPGEFVARRVTGAPTPCVPLADTLAGLQGQLPLGLARVGRRPADPSDLAGTWLAEQGRA